MIEFNANNASEPPAFMYLLQEAGSTCLLDVASRVHGIGYLFRSNSSDITTINQQYLLPLLLMQQMLQDTSNGIDFTFIIASGICPLDTSLTLRKIFVGSFMPDIMD